VNDREETGQRRHDKPNLHAHRELEPPLRVALGASTRHTIKRIRVMRIFAGIVLGIFLTIGFAYVYDASTSRPSEPTAQTGVQQRPMVNWDVVTSNWQGWSSGVRNTWHKLASR
jgi:hypothetical protein